MNEHEVSWTRTRSTSSLRSPVEVRTRILILAAVLRRLALETATPDGGVICLLKRSMSGSGCESKIWPGNSRREKRRCSTVRPAPIAPGGQREVSWQGEALSRAWLGSRRVVYAADSTHSRTWAQSWTSCLVHGMRTAAWISDPAIVSESEAVRERELAEIWYWRATTEVLRRDGVACR